MQGSADDRPLGRVVRSVRATDWAGKAKGVVSALKDQYHAGRQGEELPVQPLWPSPKEQLTALKGLLRSAPNRTDPPTDEATDAEAAQLADAMRGVNWADVRAATAERTSDVAQSMRTMAEHVDWAKVQPVAAQVSSALIAAMAAGQDPRRWPARPDPGPGDQRPEQPGPSRRPQPAADTGDRTARLSTRDRGHLDGWLIRRQPISPAGSRPSITALPSSQATR